MTGCVAPSHVPSVVPPPSPYGDAYIIPPGAFDAEQVCAASTIDGMRPLCITVGEFRRYVNSRLSAENHTVSAH